jgi:acyl-coenzyme A thioesterase PaaI-like protein
MTQLTTWDEDDDPSRFLRPMGLAIGPGEGTWGGQAIVSDELRIPGTARIRSSVLACWADMVSGSQTNTQSPDRISLTVDLTVRLLAPPVAETVAIHSEILKEGRSVVFCEARMFDEHGTLFALSHMTFQGSPRPDDARDSALVPERIAQFGAVAPTYPSPFFEYLQIRTTKPGTCELDRVPRVMNQAGTIQGGAVAAVIEAAAEDLHGPVGDMELHYLSGAGPPPHHCRWRPEVRWGGRSVAGRATGSW